MHDSKNSRRNARDCFSQAGVDADAPLNLARVRVVGALTARCPDARADVNTHADDNHRNVSWQPMPGFAPVRPAPDIPAVA